MMAFSRSRGPRGPDRIADIEQNTGRALPPAYRDLVMATGGGICHPGMRVRFRKMQVRGRTVTRILGNGVLCDGAENSLDSAAVRDLAPDFRIISSAPLLRRPHSGSSSSGTGRCFRLHRQGLWPFSMTSTGFSTGWRPRSPASWGNWRGMPRSFPHRRWIRLLSTRFIGRSRGFRCPATSYRLPVIAVWRSRVR